MGRSSSSANPRCAVQLCGLLFTMLVLACANREATQRKRTQGPVAVSSVLDWSGAHGTLRRSADGWSVTRGTYTARMGSEGYEIAARTFAPRSNAGIGAALHLTTSRIARNGAPSTQQLSVAPVLDEQGRLVRPVAAGVLERVETRGAGLELSWGFDETWTRAGEVAIDIDVSGQEYVKTDATGLHFRDRSTGRGIRFSHGSWVDAHGTRTAVLAQYLSGRIQLRVPEQTIHQSVFPAVLDPSIGPEFEIDESGVVAIPPTVGPPLSNVVLGFSAGTYLVTWSDPAAPSDTHAARVRASDGAVLDDTAIVLSGVKNVLKVRSDGTNFLVVGAGTLARITISDGTFVDSIALPSGASDVAYANGYYGVATRTGSKVSLSRWSASTGASAGAATSVTSTAAAFAPAVVGLGANIWIAWSDSRNVPTNDIYVARVGAADGVLVDSAGLPAATTYDNEGAPALATNGVDLLVVNDTGSTTNTRGMRLGGSDGAPLDGSTYLGGFVIGSRGSSAPALGLLYDGTNYVVDNYTFRVRPSDAVVLSRPAPLPAELAGASVAAGALSWVRPTSDAGDSSVALTRVDVDDLSLTDGSDGITVTKVNVLQQRPPQQLYDSALRLLRCGANYAVFWNEQSALGDKIYALRIRGSDGALFDREARVVPGLTGDFDVASDGTHFVAINRTGDPPALRFRLDTEQIEPTSIDVRASGVACTPSGICLLVFIRDVNMGPSGVFPNVLGIRVRADTGEVLDPSSGISILGSICNYSAPSVVANDSAFYVMALQQRIQCGENQVFTSVVSTEGQVHGSAMFSEDVLHAPSVRAFSGGSEFLAFLTTAQGISASRINTMGQVVQTIPVMVPAGPSVVSSTFDGMNHLVVLLNGGNSFTGKRYQPSDGAPLDGNAASLGFPIMAVAAGGGDLASTGAGRSLLAYAVDGRIYGRLIDEADGGLSEGGGYADAGAPFDAGHGGGAPGDAGGSTSDAGHGNPSDAGAPASDAGHGAGDAGHTPDAGNPVNRDAGTTRDGGTGGGHDAGGPSDGGGHTPAPDAQAGDDASIADGGASHSSGGGGRCSVRAPGRSSGGAHNGASTIAMLMGFLALTWRRRARRARTT